MAFQQFFVLAIVAILVPSILGMEFMVGDDKGWTINFDYQSWAKGKEFHVGDKLMMKHICGPSSRRQSSSCKTKRGLQFCKRNSVASPTVRKSASTVFKYPEGAHSVIKVNGTAFQQCAISAGNGILTSGNDVITLTTPGNKWYICGVARHCEVENQKLFITVSENNSDTSSTATGSIAPMYYGWMTAIFGILMMVMV